MAMPSRPRVIVTRPAAQADTWVQGLQAQGLDAHSFPLIEIADGLTAQARTALQARVFGSVEFAVCMWVSRNAVDYFFQKNSAASHINRAQAAHENIAIAARLQAVPVRHWATGPGTVQALLAHGVPLAQVDAPRADAAQWDSQGLWAQVHAQVQAGCRLLVVRGQDVDTLSASRDWLADQVRARGGAVEFASVYQRRAPRWSAEQTAWARQAAQDGSLWVFSSSQAIAHLPQLGANPGSSPWALARCVVTHARIAQAAQAAGFAVVCTSRPSVHDVAQSIKSRA